MMGVKKLMLPYWLLRLLPMWSFVCPKCRKEVKQKSHKCPFCNENYGVPLRVPPKVLKDQKALEEYVHKHVFPIISQEQRVYLTQFFTEILTEGFESGGTAGWSITTTAGETVAASTTLPHHGSYSLAATCDGSATGEMAYIYRTLGSAYSEIYVRAYYRFTALTPTNGKSFCSSPNLRNSTTAAALSYIRVTNRTGTCIWAVYYMNAGTGIYADTTSVVLADKWYCVELYVKVDLTAGAYNWWIDGTSVYSVTGVDSLTARGNINLFHFGERWADEAFAHTVYVDCIVIADTYVGPEELQKYKDWKDWWYDNRLI